MFLAKNKREGHCFDPSVISSWFTGDHPHHLLSGDSTAIWRGCQGSGPTSSSLCVTHILGTLHKATHCPASVSNPSQQPEPRDVQQVGVSLDYLDHYSQDHKTCVDQWSSSFSFHNCNLSRPLMTCHELWWGLFLPQSFLSLLLCLLFLCYPMLCKGYAVSLHWKNNAIPLHRQDLLIVRGPAIILTLLHGPPISVLLPY